MRQRKSRTEHKRARTARLAPLAAFAAGLALGAGLIVAAAPLDRSAPPVAELEAGDHVVAIGDKPRHRPVVASASKGALADVPPRMLTASITVKAPPRDLPEIVIASGKRSLTLPPLRRTLGGFDTASNTPKVDPRPAIAVVIDDLGVVADRSARSLGLPEEVTLSFLPYGATSRILVQAAAAQGHEIFLHMPMQPVGPEDAGPGALMVHQSDRTLRERLAEDLDELGRAGPVAGVNNHMGSRATADRRVMDAVMAVTSSRGIAYLDSLTTARSAARAAAAAHDVPFATRDIFLDHNSGPDFLLAQLSELEDRARENGVAIAIAHPHDTTLDVLEVWVRGLERKGLRLVPVTEAIRLQNAPSRMLALAE